MAWGISVRLMPMTSETSVTTDGPSDRAFRGFVFTWFFLLNLFIEQNKSLV